jgi:hypothetical protein
LKKEGIPEEKIFLVGNVMVDSLLFNLEIPNYRCLALIHINDLMTNYLVTNDLMESERIEQRPRSRDTKTVLAYEASGVVGTRQTM